MTKLKNWFIGLWNRLLNKTTIDEQIMDTVADAKEKLESVKEEFADVAEELKDVMSAIKGKVTKSKLRSMTKVQMLEAAKKDHNVELDSKLNKTNLINKVYELYNK
jgi:uncharacterized protein (UPF0335 family)